MDSNAINTDAKLRQSVVEEQLLRAPVVVFHPVVDKAFQFIFGDAEAPLVLDRWLFRKSDEIEFLFRKVEIFLRDM